MIKKTIRYEDLEGNEVEDDFYFHFNKLELTKLAAEYEKRGGIENYFMNLVKTQDAVALIDLVQDLVKGAYGKRSDDSRSFIKNELVLSEFTGREAYDNLVMELATNPTSLDEFIRGMSTNEVRRLIQQESDKQLKKVEDYANKEPDPHGSLEATTFDRQSLTTEDFTKDEIVAMSRADLDALFAGKLYKKPNLTPPLKTLEQYNRHELLTMPDEEFDRVAGKDQKKWSKAVLAIAMMRRTRPQ